MRLLFLFSSAVNKRASKANSIVVAPIVKGLDAIHDFFSSCSRFRTSDYLGTGKER